MLNSLGSFDPLELPTAWSGDAVNVHDMMHRLVIFKWPPEEEFPERKRFLTEIRKTVIHELATTSAEPTRTWRASTTIRTRSGTGSTICRETIRANDAWPKGW